MNIREACFRGLPSAKKVIILHKAWREAVRSGQGEAFEIAWDIARYGSDRVNIYMEEDIRDTDVPSSEDAELMLDRMINETNDTGLNLIKGRRVWSNKQGVDALIKELAEEWQEEVLKESGLR